jgi:hypothetical protein
MKPLMKPRKPSKLKNIKTEIDNIVFASKKEARRYLELKLLQQVGKIKKLELQKRFLLVDSMKLSNGKKERPIHYQADFCYWIEKDYIVEDVKGLKTSEYIIKRKLMKFFYGIEIKEV